MEYLPSELWETNLYDFLSINTKCQFLCLTHSEAKRYQNDIWVWSRGRFTAGPCEEHGWLMPQRTLQSPKRFQGTIVQLKARWGRGLVGCHTLLGVGILCSCSCLCQSSQDIPVNLQQDKWETFFAGEGSPKSPQMVTTAKKLKDTCSLEGKLWPT